MNNKRTKGENVYQLVQKRLKFLFNEFDNIYVSFSGGKDSTAMLLMMLEKGMPVDEIIFCDTGMEFPEVYQHIKQVEKYIGRKITRLSADYSFEYY